ncbi:MAG: hypothetical protein J7647_26585 [Cyanobacteria bacterium SBLK]|nr:hypothetical protein [Cyanobacteria bacterium SBLK]
MAQFSFERSIIAFLHSNAGLAIDGEKGEGCDRKQQRALLAESEREGAEKRTNSIRTAKITRSTSTTQQRSRSLILIDWKCDRLTQPIKINALLHDC